MPGEAAAIELDQLSVRYGKAIAVEGLSGGFAPGSLTAVVGPNGAGKSTLLKAIAGIIAPHAGSIRCAAERLAYLPQQADIDRDFPVTVAELVALGAWRRFGAFRRPPPETAERAAAALAAVGMGDLADRPIDRLSVGQFQRALFARLLLQDAAVILLDEPFAAIDQGTIDDLLVLLRDWHAERRTVIVVLHDLALVREHFPQALLLARRPIAWSDTATALTEGNLAAARRALAAAAP